MRSTSLRALRAPEGSPDARATERELAARIQAGDIDARNELVERNLDLAVRWAVRRIKRHPCASMDLDDLLQECRLAMIRAAELFDPETHGTRYSTYATWWIRRRLYIATANQDDLVRLPLSIHEQGQANERRIRLKAFTAGFDDPGITEDHLSQLVEKENRDRLRRALSKLPAKERTTLLCWATEFGRGGRLNDGESRNARRNRAHAAKRLIERLRWSLNREGRP